MRCFIALELSPETRLKIGQFTASFKQQFKHLPVKWVETENLHLTLKFLGDTSPAQLETLKKELSAHALKKISLSIKGGGCFKDKNHHPTVLFLNLDNGALKSAADYCENAAVKAGYEREKRIFHAHLTLSRIKKPVPSETADIFMQNARNFAADEVFSSFVLFESILRPEGPEYIKKAVFKLL